MKSTDLQNDELNSGQADYVFVAPFSLYDPHRVFNEPFSLDEEIMIQRLPDWVRKDKDVLEGLSWSDQQFLSSDCYLAFVVKYTGSVITGQSLNDKRDVLSNKVGMANIALWLARPCQCGIRMRLHFRQSNDVYRHSSSSTGDRGIYHHKDSTHEYLTVEDANNIKILYAKLLAIENNSLLRIAIRYLWMALHQKIWELRFTSLWILMECLFFPADGELSFRVAQRAAFFVENDLAHRKQLFDDLRDSYTWRCKVVHGSKGLQKLEPSDSAEMVKRLEEIGRQAITRILLDPVLTKTFNGKRRGEYLDSQVFAEQL